MISKGQQRGKEVQDDCGIEKVDSLPHGVGDSIGAGATEGEDLDTACAISSLETGTAEGFFFRRPLPGRLSLGVKKWSRNTLLISTGSEALAREWNLELSLAATSCFAIQMLFGEVLLRKSAQ